MQKIEINTTQNVSIEFEAALLRDRILAFIIDFLIMGGASIILSIIISIAFTSAAEYLYYLFIVPIIFFYSLAFETLNHGQSPGKRVMDLKVVKLNGAEPRSSDYVLRWAFRMIDIYLSFGVLAAIFIGSSNKNQRLGDMAAETTIIKIKPAKALRLNDIININSIDNYKPVFPEVKKLSESNMLLIKNVIERYKAFPNQAHREAMRMLVSKVKEEINVDQGSSRDIDFLQTLIKDYVVLTR
ncbi:RDD family protein [Fulvivirga kasyanovii]|uniref:RDD family protein n=1 Tax=Fulvivirga kasyanovii TaxID=396812 RepID=A0ABW9RPC7_9BACT|nr:RDD family protein [Fulvivirga kasyanovii]MTI25858.1 RDD family protein [Fulvivirga kasyanovii]